MNKCKSEMKRSVTEDKGGIDERDKSEKEGEMRTKKKKHEFVVCINVIKTLFERERRTKFMAR